MHARTGFGACSAWQSFFKCDFLFMSSRDLSFKKGKWKMEKKKPFFIITNIGLIATVNVDNTIFLVCRLQRRVSRGFDVIPRAEAAMSTWQGKYSRRWNTRQITPELIDFLSGDLAERRSHAMRVSRAFQTHLTRSGPRQVTG
jgi:hypothetical protein